MIYAAAAFVEGRQRLRSAATGALLVPRAQTATGQRSFAVNGPTVWNSLPPALCSPDLSQNTFKLSGHWRRIYSHPSSDTESFRDFAAAYKSADLLTYLAAAVCLYE